MSAKNIAALCQLLSGLILLSIEGLLAYDWKYPDKLKNE
jgi:hypothetical protein